MYELFLILLIVSLHLERNVVLGQLGRGFFSENSVKVYSTLIASLLNPGEYFLLDGQSKFSESLEEGMHSFAIPRPEKDRLFDIYIPPNLQENPALLVDFHTVWFNQKVQVFFSGWKEKADETGEFIVVFPAGYKGSWNGINCCVQATVEDIDDVGFIKEMITVIQTLIEFDPSRVYAFGYSNGASIVNRLGYQASDVFAAIAVNSYHLDDGLYEEAKQLQEDGLLENPIPVLAIHGTNDRSVCWEETCFQFWGFVMVYFGFIFDGFLGEETVFTGAKYGWHRWAELNNCTDDITDIDDIAYSEYHDVNWIQGYKSCADGVEVIQIQNTRHHSNENPFNGKSGGINMKDYNDIIWDFLKRWSREESNPTP